ncbi:MAG: hypothetical protein ACK5Z4_16180, partial [Planctomyces sp.]
MIAVTMRGPGRSVRGAAWPRSGAGSPFGGGGSDIQVPDLQRVLLDELPPLIDVLAHEDAE